MFRITIQIKYILTFFLKTYSLLIQNNYIIGVRLFPFFIFQKIGQNKL